MRKHPQQMSMIHARSDESRERLPLRTRQLFFLFGRPPSQFLFRSIDLSARWPARFVIFVHLMSPFATQHKEVDKLYQNNRSAVKGMHFDSVLAKWKFGWVTTEGREPGPRVNNRWKLIVKSFRVLELEENSGWIIVGNRKCGSDVVLLSSHSSTV